MDDDDDVVPLSTLRTGQQATVIAMEGGHDFHARVTSMGIFPGCEIRVLGGGDGGRMVLAVGDTRIGIGHGMTGRILVARDPVGGTS